jgi:hypothetical protein
MSSLNYHKTIFESGIKNYRPAIRGGLLIRFVVINFLLAAFLMPCFSIAKAAEIGAPQIKVLDSDIYVTTALSLDDRHLQELRNGITKELRFHFSIYRVWKMWPDEFVSGKSFVRILKCDPVKTEFTATSNDGTTLVQKRFRSFESMTQWALGFEDLKLANIRDLDPGVYFVRVTAESMIRKLPPVLGYFMVFLRETEFKVTSDSALITVGPGK